MKDNIKLSIITVNYNGLKDTCDFIRSVQSSEITVPYELIVVDNGSKENEAAILQQQYPSVNTIRSHRNLGFAGGNNIGINLASGDYIYLLNNDTLLPANGGTQILSIIRFFEDNPRVGAISPKILYTDTPDLLQFAGSTPLSRYTLRNEQIGYRLKDNGLYDTPTPTPYMHGAAMFLKREVVLTAGLIPECYFLYYEELDWSVRISEKFDLYYFPYAIIYHKESSSIGQDSPLKIYYLYRNRLLFAHRNSKGIEQLLTKAYLTFIAAPYNAFKYILHGKSKLAIAIVEGVYSYYTTSFK